MTHRSHVRRSRLAVLLLGAAPALMLAAAMPAQAGGAFWSMHQCVDDNPRQASDALRACTRIIEDRHAEMAQIRRALVTRGTLRANRADFTGASNDFARAITLGDTGAATYLGLGRAQMRLNDPQALTSLDAAAHAPNADFAVLYEIFSATGEIQLTRQDWNAADTAYGSAFANAASGQQQARAYVGRGHASLGAGRLDAAIDDYTQATSIDRTSADAALALADALRFRATRQQTDQAYSAAETAYAAALDLAPVSENPQRRNVRARALTGRGQLYLAYYRHAGDQQALVKAATDFNDAIAIDSLNTAALSGRATVFAQSPASLQRAVADLDQALRVNPNNGDLYRARGDLYAQLGNPENAMRDYDAALQNGGARSYGLYIRRGRIYLDAADYRRAEQSFAQAQTLAEGGYLTPGADPRIALASALSLRGRATWGLIDEPGANAQDVALRAVSFADRAAAIEQQNARFVAGRCLARTVGGGQWSVAEGACTQAINLAQAPSNQADLGYSLGAMGLLQLRWALAGARTQTEEVQRLNAAVGYLRNAIAADAPDASQAALHQYAQGVVFECLGQQGEANRMMRDALTVDRGVAAHFEAHRIRRCHA